MCCHNSYFKEVIDIYKYMCFQLKRAICMLFLSGSGGGSVSYAQFPTVLMGWNPLATMG